MFVCAYVCMFDRQTHASGVCDAPAHRCSKFSKQTGEAREQREEVGKEEEEGRKETGAVSVLFLCLVQHVPMLIKFHFPTVAHTQKCLLCDTYAHTFSSMSRRCGQEANKLTNSILNIYGGFPAAPPVGAFTRIASATI